MKHNFRLSFTFDDKSNEIVDDRGNVFDIASFEKGIDKYFRDRFGNFMKNLDDQAKEKELDKKKASVYKGSRVKYALSIFKKHQSDPNYIWVPTDFDLEDTTRSPSVFKNVLNLTIDAEGVDTNLNWIDVSNVTDMSLLFSYSNFNGDLSNWDVSNVKNMSFMFTGSEFNNNSISNWNVSNVVNMNHMFYGSSFDGDLSKWDVSKASDADLIYNMFGNTPLYKNNNLPSWYVNRKERKKESSFLKKYTTKINERNQFNKDIKNLLNN